MSTAPIGAGAGTSSDEIEPDRDCTLCPRLRAFLLKQRDAHGDWHNAPVGTWYPPGGRLSVRLLVVGLAPGLRGANRTGRPFTGDDAGALLHAALIRFGLAENGGPSRADEDLRLCRTAITNAVRCVPPANRPVAAEIDACRRFLKATISAMPNLTAILTLGRIAHDSTIRALGGEVAAHRFRHGGRSAIGRVSVFSSYHCSRYNTQTGRLTPEMFAAVVARIAAGLDRTDTPGR